MSDISTVVDTYMLGRCIRAVPKAAGERHVYRTSDISASCKRQLRVRLTVGRTVDHTLRVD